MKQYIEYVKTSKFRVPLKRGLTLEEYEIFEDNMFDLPFDVVDWDDEEEVDADHTHWEILDY